MKRSPLAGLSIRTGVLRKGGLGYLLACDRAREEKEEMHTEFFKWDHGKFTRGSLNFDAHTCCMISMPETALVMVAGHGEFGVTTATARIAENILDSDPGRETYGMFRNVAEVAGKAYVVGMEGLAYRLDTLTKWTRIDKGLKESFDATAVDGFAADDLYAVGYGGQCWHFDGKRWARVDLPTNANLNCVKCAADGKVYIGGYDGTLICGRDAAWELIESDITENWWDLDWFANKLFLSSITAVYTRAKRAVKRVDFGDDPPDTCYHLSVADGELWSIGSDDVMSFDGSQWSRVV